MNPTENTPPPKVFSNVDRDILDSYSPLKITKILPTAVKKRDNAFEFFRPDLDEVLDYNLSETWLKLRAKDVQINVKQTRANYVPRAEEDIKAAQRLKEIKYSSGGPPKWKFINEIWREKQAARQTKNQKSFANYVHNIQKENKQNENYYHKVLQSMVGPEWYQELSPKQIKTVDKFESCIIEDLENNTIINTKENIANLGLVIRPHPKKIELALKYCCGCPVEFLLTLYQLLEPKRTRYSLNDRLLLSAVVHLTMTSTLKELHIRIPSPPRRKKETTTVTVRPKKKKYGSPYLEPYTFKPQPAKFTGKYYNKHCQYPDSLYFTYLKDMYAERRLLMQRKDELILDFIENEPIDKELTEETATAQILYNQLHKRDDIKLLKPSVVKVCKDFQEYETQKHRKRSKKLVLPPLFDLPDRDIKCVCQEALNANICCQRSYGVKCDCDECKCKEKTWNLVKSLCEKCAIKREHKNARNIITGICIIACDITIPIIGGNFLEQTCYCKEQYTNRLKGQIARNNLQCLKKTYVVSGLVMSRVGPVYCLSTAILNSRLKKLYKMQQNPDNEVNKTCKAVNIPEKCPSICKKEIEDYRTSASKEKAMDDQESIDITSSENRSLCCGDHADEEEKVNVTNNDKKCTCVSAKSSSSAECKCRQELDKILKERCKCETCTVEERRANATYIISGTETLEEDETVRVISGVQEYKCDCLAKYLEKLKKFEEYKQRIKARMDLKSQNNKYAIGGVASTAEGPVYLITGMRKPVECICAEIYREKQLLEEQARRSAKLPDEETCMPKVYQIQGVCRGQDENVFILGGATPRKKCSCENLFEEYEKVHNSCLGIYQNFLTDIKEQTELYEKEMSNVRDSFVPTVEQEDFASGDQKTVSPCSCDFIREEPQIFEEDNEPCLRNNQEETEVFDESAESGAQENSETENDEKCCEESDSEESVTFDPSYTISTVTNTVKMDTTSIQSVPNEQNLKRFIILSKFPGGLNKQKLLIQKALNAMAKDGFPLAKLPDSFKLPHFELWLQLRTRKKWTQKDRKFYENFSILAWGHTDVCYKNIDTTNVTPNQPKYRNLTWKTADYWREVMREKLYSFHRDVKKTIIDHTREFFPSTCTYEFPTSSFRDCFFAYCPSKEEDCIVGSS